MIKNDFLFYKGYYGSIHFDSKEEIFYGKVEFIRDLVNYEGKEAKTLVNSFHEAIDSYLEDCEELARSPDKPFKGSFNVRIDPQLHREASLYAMQRGETLNSIIKKALDDYIKLSRKYHA